MWPLYKTTRGSALNELATITEHDIRARLQRPLNTTYDLPGGSAPNKQAAVLVPFVREADEWHLLFIKRSERENDRHSGQVAFAGGRYEETDTSLEMTALRETHEEIGVNPDDVQVLGELNHHHSISNYQITPVVGTMPWPYQLTLEVAEVAAAFTIPLRWLADPANHRVQERTIGESRFPVIFFEPYNGYVLWGATARMTLSLISLLRKP